MTGAGGAVSVKIDPLLWRFGLGGNGFPEGARSAGVPYFNAYAGTPYPTMRPVLQGDSTRPGQPPTKGGGTPDREDPELATPASPFFLTSGSTNVCHARHRNLTDPDPDRARAPGHLRAAMRHAAVCLDGKAHHLGFSVRPPRGCLHGRSFGFQTRGLKREAIRPGQYPGRSGRPRP